MKITERELADVFLTLNFFILSSQTGKIALKFYKNILKWLLVYKQKFRIMLFSKFGETKFSYVRTCLRGTVKFGY